MASAIVTLKVTPNELQYIRAALVCYAANIRAGDYSRMDLTAAGNEPHKAMVAVTKLIQDIGLKS